MSKIRKNKIPWIIVSLSFLNLLMIQQGECDTDYTKDCCHQISSNQSSDDTSCCVQEEKYQHTKKLDYCGCVHTNHSSDNFISYNIISIEKTTFVEYDYLVAPTINYNYIKDHTYFNLSEIPIYISKQSFLI